MARPACRPVWSPDGGRIAFTRAGLEPDALTDVWTIDLATREAINLTEGRGVSRAPVWSPDGSRIAFAGQLEPERPLGRARFRRLDRGLVRIRRSGGDHRVVRSLRRRPVWSGPKNATKCSSWRRPAGKRISSARRSPTASCARSAAAPWSSRISPFGATRSCSAPVPRSGRSISGRNRSPPPPAAGSPIAISNRAPRSNRNG